MRYILAFIFIVFMSGVSLAQDIQIVDQIGIDLGNGATLTINPVQNFTAFYVYGNGESTNSNYFRLDLNGSQLWLSSANDKTISQMNYSISDDRWNFTASGSSGYLNIRGLMAQPNANYDLFNNGSLYNTQVSDSNGLVSYTYNGGWSVHNFSILPQIPGPTPTPSPTSTVNPFTPTQQTSIIMGAVRLVLLVAFLYIVLWMTVLKPSRDSTLKATIIGIIGLLLLAVLLGAAIIAIVMMVI